jgi:hypothetical protein
LNRDHASLVIISSQKQHCNNHSIVVNKWKRYRERRGKTIDTTTKKIVGETLILGEKTGRQRQTEREDK